MTGAPRSAATPARSSERPAIQADDVNDIERYTDVGADHVILMSGGPFDLAPLQTLIDQRDSLG